VHGGRFLFCSAALLKGTRVAFDFLNPGGSVKECSVALPQKKDTFKLGLCQISGCQLRYSFYL
jgi:hypothetical protein